MPYSIENDDRFWDLLLKDINNPEGGSFWVEILHMENEGFDIVYEQAILRFYMQRAIKILGSDPAGLDLEREKRVAWQLRQKLRASLNLEPLRGTEGMAVSGARFERSKPPDREKRGAQH
jgi:hypothetical protein